jgi:hypothetical protein
MPGFLTRKALGYTNPNGQTVHLLVTILLNQADVSDQFQPPNKKAECLYNILPMRLFGYVFNGTDLMRVTPHFIKEANRLAK